MIFQSEPVDGELMKALPAIVVGGGPAGLMAAEALLNAGVSVTLYDKMPSVARKLIVAGKSNLSLTRDEPFEQFLGHYRTRAAQLRPFLQQFSPKDLRAWTTALGIETFVGSSGLVFPADLTADTLLNRWLQRLTTSGLQICCRHEWCGWDASGTMCFATPEGVRQVEWQAAVLALGGGSWPHLGSTGAWTELLREKGIMIEPLLPANCGFDVPFSSYFLEKYQGHPVKNVVLILPEGASPQPRQRGEFLITSKGVEGGLFYTHGPIFREALSNSGTAVACIDLCPDRSVEQLRLRLSQPRGSRSMASHLRKTIGIEGVRAGLLYECASRDVLSQPERLAAALKCLSIPLTACRPLAEAISCSGGIRFSELDEQLMVRRLPGVFCAGEMLDWEAPTGGYLITACMATGKAAGAGAAAWLQRTKSA